MKQTSSPSSARTLLLGLLFYVIVVCYLSALWYWEGEVTGSLFGKTFFSKFLRYTGDAAIICFPFMLLKPKYRWAIFIPVYISTFWVIGCLWYFRQWGDLPGVSSLFLMQNVGTTLFASILALWDYVDLMFIGLLLLLTFIYLAFWRRPVKSAQFPTRLKGAFAAIAVSLFCLSQYISSHVTQVYLNSVQIPLSFMQATSHRVMIPIDINKYDLCNGPLIHFIKSSADAVQILTLKKSVTDSDRNIIENFRADSEPAASLPDSLIAANAKKNIVLIVVESLNSYAIHDSINGEPAAPVLASLIDQPGTLSALNVVSQVGCGCSSDGQIIINTGLHPLKKFPAAMALSSNTFPSLVHAFNRHANCVVFADNGKSWNKFNTFRSFGFETIYAEDDFKQIIEQEGKDAALLRVASSVIDTIPQPFFMELLTLSMHSPFNDLSIPDSKLPYKNRKKFESLDIKSRYLAMVKYFDTELGLFIDRLKAADCYDNTMLIIVSDHSQEVTTCSGEQSESSDAMSLIIANCGITERIDRTVGEIDVFPTILHLTGTSSIDGWRGVGSSILNPRLNAAITPSGVFGSCDDATMKRLSEASDISELILRTDYFAVQ